MDDVIKYLSSVIKEIYDLNQRRYLVSFNRAGDWENFASSFFKKNIKYPHDRVLLSELLHVACVKQSYDINNWDKTARNVLSKLEEMFNNNPEELYIVGNINNVEVRKNFKIGKINIVNFNRYYLNKLKNKGFKHSELNGFINKPVVIYGPIKDKNHRLALNNGYQKIEEFFNVARFLYDNKEKSSGNLYVRFGIKDFNYGHIVSFSRDRYYSESKAKRVVVIDNNFIVNIKRLGLVYLKNILIESPKTEIEQKILDAIHWFGLAKMSYDKKQEFISYFTALEILLCAGDDNSISADLAERIPKVYCINFSIDFDYKKEIYKDVKRLYGVRSAIVHRNKNINVDDLVKVNDYCRHCIRNFLQIYNSEKFTTKDDFKNWILKTSF